MRVAYYTGMRNLSKTDIERAIQNNGLDQPIIVQYFNWLKKIISLDFGRSMTGDDSGAPVIGMIMASLPSTLELLLYSVPIIAPSGVWLGTKAAIEQNKGIDHLARVIGILGASMPVFVVAGVLIMLSLAIQNPYQVKLDPYLQLSYDVGYSLNLRIASGNFTIYTNMVSIDALLNGDVTLFLDAMLHLILPVATLVVTQCAALIKVTRSGLIGELGKPYVVSAVARGLSDKEAAYKHARKNASISVLTVLGLLLSNMFISIAIVEIMFRRSGFASLVVSSALRMNTPVLFGCVMFIVIFLFSRIPS
jgi:ABC-type dipeptide/oligopeptide/nickel transport system permease component